MSFEPSDDTCLYRRKGDWRPERGASWSRQYFYNRLKNTCPCKVIRRLLRPPSGLQRQISPRPTCRNTPSYNTYTIKASPTWPHRERRRCRNQGGASPSTTDFLYFVSNEPGQPYFFQTYSQHARQVTTWQKEYFHKQMLARHAKH